VDDIVIASNLPNLAEEVESGLEQHMLMGISSIAWAWRSRGKEISFS
jgi:hypothetical protein